MAQIGDAVVEVGDLLRRDSDDREGTVVDVVGDDVTVRFSSSYFEPDGSDVTAPASEWYYNSWDPKFATSGKTAPVRKPTVMG